MGVGLLWLIDLVVVVVVVTFSPTRKVEIFLGRESKDLGKFLLLLFTSKSPSRFMK